MDVNSCYVCGSPIPELRMKDGKYSFYCDRCTYATKWKEDLFEAQSDWNEGVTYCEDGTRFWNLVVNSKEAEINDKEVNIHIGDRVGTVKGRGVVSMVHNDEVITVDLDGDHGSYMFYKNSVWKIDEVEI